MTRAVLLFAVGFLTMLPESADARPQAAATLHALIQQEWQYQLEHSPTYASVQGDRRWNGRWDDLSLEAIAADHQHNLQVLAKLKTVDRKALSAADQLNYDLFRRDYETWVEEHRFKTYLMPVNHMGGIPEGIKQPPGVQTAYQLADNLRFETVKDYEDWVARLQGFGTYVDQVLALLREGLREKRIHPRSSSSGFRRRWRSSSWRTRRTAASSRRSAASPRALPPRSSNACPRRAARRLRRACSPR